LKKLAVLLIAVFVLILAVPASAGYNHKVDVFVNDNPVVFPDQKPFIDTKASRTYVPLRFVSEALGAVVDWDDSKQTAIVVRGGKKIEMRIGTNIVLVDGKTATIDAPAMLVNSRTVVPLRFVSEVLGAAVEWAAPVGSGNGRVLIYDGVTPKPGKPADVARLERIHGVTMTQDPVVKTWHYIPPREETFANKDRSHVTLSWTEGGSIRVSIAWARILPDIREVKVDLTPIQKTLDGFFPGHPKIPEIMAKAKEMADIRRASGGSERHESVNYHLNGQRVMLQSGGGNFVSLAIIY